MPELVFGSPLRLDPSERDNAFSCQEYPLNRNRKFITKQGTAGTDGLWLQEFDPVIGWKTEVQLSTQIPNADGQPRHEGNAYGDLMFVFAKWDAGAGFYYLTGLWKDGQGVYADIEQRLDAAPVQEAVSSVNNRRWAVTAIDNATRDFWIFWVLYDAGAIGDLIGRKFNGTARTWDAAINFGRPNLGAGAVSGPVVASWQQLDNSIHIAVGALPSVAFANQEVYYKRYDVPTNTMDAAWDRLTTSAWPNVLLFGVAGSEMDAVCDTINKDQFYIVATRFNNTSAGWADCEILFFEKDLSVSPPVWKAGVRISQSATRGAHFPTLICDTNGDLYVVWTEHDTPGTGFRSVWLQQKPYLSSWQFLQKVADSNYETNAGAADPDPEHPGIIRPPRFQPVTNLCITWGDMKAGGIDGPYVYVNCAVVRTLEEQEFEEGVGGVIVNNIVQMQDLNVGNPWHRWVGKDV